MLRRYLSAIALLLVATLTYAADRQRYALLVGVSRYPRLDKKYQLEGPQNDVVLMRQLLIDKFAFPADDRSIHVLSEPLGEADPSRLPTRENISREFSRLADVAADGDDVVVFLAGHGSQQPQQPGDGYPEPDGLDQIFLPRDVGRWEDSGNGGNVENCIADNEIAEWLRRIRGKGAHVWAIFDCCHAGDITRGPGETERYVPEGTDGLAIPDATVRGAKERTRQQEQVRDRGVMEIGRQDAMAILYACQRNEKAIERPFPTSATSNHHGLLTYCLGSVLSQTEGALSYRELGKRVHLEYIRLGRTSGPTPLAEGGDIARSVLGIETINRSNITVTFEAKSGNLKVDAGRLQGVTPNSVLAVFPPPGKRDANQDKKPIGYVRVDRAFVEYAIVSPCPYGKLPASQAQQLVGGRCETEELDYGDLRLVVGVARTDNAGGQIPNQTRGMLDSVLEGIGNEKGSLVKRTATLAEAEWLIRFIQGAVVLTPATGVPVAERSKESAQELNKQDIRLFKLGSLPTPMHERDEIKSALTRVARANNLLNLAVSSSTQQGQHGAFSVNFKLDIQRMAAFPTEAGDSLRAPVSVKSGDLLEVKVNNNGNVPFDLTLLYIDSRFGIAALFPVEGENNRLHPGNSKAIPSIAINGETCGREHLVAVALSSKSDQPVNFIGLAQPSIERFRSGRHDEIPHLQNLFETGLYGEGTTRAAGRKEVTSFRMDVIPFDVSTEPR